MVPNHALIIHALLYGDGDFRRTQMIVNTSGWDTDCNAANVGCILGIRGGLAALRRGLRLARPGRGPAVPLDRRRQPRHHRRRHRVVSDRQRRPRRSRARMPIAPKDGAKFHFSLPGSVQGFTAGDPAPRT